MIYSKTPFATKDNTTTLPSQLRCATLLAAPRWCAACGHGIAADKGNSFVRHARTAHRAAAHYAWLTLKEGGKNSHRRGFAAPPPSKREARLYGVPAVNSVREEGSHASRPCVRASFLPTMAKNSFRDARTPHCGDAHNAPLNLPPAPSIYRLRLMRKGEIARAIMLPSARYRGKPRTEHSDCGVFLNLTTFSYRSTRKKDFTERFFAKRSGERFKRGVRRSRTARRVRSAATTSVQKEIRE